MKIKYLVPLMALAILAGCPNPEVPPADTTPPGIPSILTPMQGENTGADKRPSFMWTAVADAVAYDLQADDSPSFDSVDYNWTSLGGISYTPASDMSTSDDPPVGTRYYLRMRARDAAGNPGEWSNTGLLRYVNVGRQDNDFNGDGYADVIVGAFSFNGYQGRAYIYYGGSVIDNNADLTMTGEAISDNFGYSVGSTGDVNGDGYADAIVGAPYFNNSRGRAYIYYGGAAMDDTAEIILTGATEGRFGYGVASAGDVNGDGYADVLIGADGSDTDDKWRAYFYYGGVAMDETADLILTGDATSTYFGLHVASAGDVNGDGYDDAIVGACYFSMLGGGAYLYYGGASMDNAVDLTLNHETISTYFGWSVASAGDVNGDGYADVAVGTIGDNNYQGRAYMYYGGAAMNDTADLILNGEAWSDLFGYSVASAGDVNGDGYTDIIVGADGYNTAQGRTYIYYGGVSMDETADISLTGEEERHCFGACVASAGDVNGDGYADVIVGADWYDNERGRAYLYYGGASMDTTADLTMTGEATSNRFGHSVASIRDVNEEVHTGGRENETAWLMMITMECVLEDRRTWVEAL